MCALVLRSTFSAFMCACTSEALPAATIAAMVFIYIQRHYVEQLTCVNWPGITTSPWMRSRPAALAYFPSSPKFTRRAGRSRPAGTGARRERRVPDGLFIGTPARTAGADRQVPVHAENGEFLMDLSPSTYTTAAPPGQVFLGPHHGRPFSTPASFSSQTNSGRRHQSLYRGTSERRGERQIRRLRSSRSRCRPISPFARRRPRKR